MIQARSIWAMVFFTAGAALVGCEFIVGNQTVTARSSGSGGGGGSGSGGAAPDNAFTCLLALDLSAEGEKALGGITTDATGHVWLAGTYRGALKIGATQLPPPDVSGDTGMFLIGLDGGSGDVIVAKSFDIGPVEGGVAGIAIEDDRIYVAGRFAGKDKLGGECSLKSTASTDSDAFVARFDTFGTCISARAFPNNSPSDQVSGLAADKTRVIITGTVNNGNALFIQRYDAALTTQAFSLFAAGHDAATIAPRVAALKDDQVLIAGDFIGTFDVSFSSTGRVLDNKSDKTPDAFTVAYRPSHLGELEPAPGPYLWSEDYGSPGDQSIVALAPGKSAGVSAFYAAGQFENTVDFHVGDQRPLQAVDGKDAIVAAIGAENGKILWSKRFGEASNQSATAIAYDDLEQAVIVAGSFQGKLDLGAKPLANPDGADHIFLTRMSEGGDPVWRRAFGAKGVQSASALVARSGEIFVAGAYTGTLDFGCKAPLENPGPGSKLFVARLKPDVR